MEQKQGKTASTQGLPTHVHTYTKAHIVFKIKVKKLLLMWLNFLTFKKKNFLTQRFSFNFLIFFSISCSFYYSVIPSPFASPKCQTGRPQEGTNPAAPDPKTGQTHRECRGQVRPEWVVRSQTDLHVPHGIHEGREPGSASSLLAHSCTQERPRLWAALTSRNPQQI